MALNQEQLQFVTFYTQHFLLHGEVPSAEKARIEFGVPVGVYRACMDNPEVVEALKERGILFERLGDDWTSKSLTPLQLIVANSMLDIIDTRSQKKKLQDLNVSTSTYDAWMRDPVFKNYMIERAENILADSGHEAHLALVDKVKSGDIKAIAYLNEITGRYVKESTSNSAAIDVRNIITRVIEIVIDEVSNPIEVQNISDKLMGLITAQTIAGSLVREEEPIKLPSIKPPPVLTEEMQQLVNSGEGF